MKVDNRTYFEEEQRMNSGWMWFFALFFCITLVGIGAVLLVDKETDLTKVAIVIGSIVFSDVLIFYIFKTMKLELAITKNGFHYVFFAMIAQKGMVDWNEVEKVSIRKSPYRSYGKKHKFRYGEVYTMNTKTGVELEVKNGNRKFFSLKDPDAFMSGFQKLNLPMQLNNEVS
jgi:hypothetical protein